MGMTSAAEAKLDARIRPEITVLRSRTSYPRRARGRAAGRSALAVLPGGADAGHAARPPENADTPAGPMLAATATALRPAVRQTAARPARAGKAVSGPEASGRLAGAGRRVAVARLPHTEVIGREPAPRTTRPSGRVRLTRRGRVVVGALLTLAVAGIAALIWLAVAGQAEAAGPGGLGAGAGAGHSMLRVVVRPGETLWSIAMRTDPAADPRAVIQEIIDDNALRGPAIQAGQVLWVPRPSAAGT